ncbi:hypothetical protein HDV00_000746 [Rhizophlyctis rosea]|nr:hypothetical protein HDV00_000746 [Rhizophlyctis rosea]
MTARVDFTSLESDLEDVQEALRKETVQRYPDASPQMSGLTQRRRNVRDATADYDAASASTAGGGYRSSLSPALQPKRSLTPSPSDRANDDSQIDPNTGKPIHPGSSLTILEEVLLLRLVEDQGHLSFCNGNI